MIDESITETKARSPRRPTRRLGSGFPPRSTLPGSRRSSSSLAKRPHSERLQPHAQHDQKRRIGFEVVCDGVSPARSPHSALSYSPAGGIFVPGRAPPQQGLRANMPRSEMADRLRGVVRWWVGGEEPAQRTCVREQAPQTASRQRAADRSRGDVSGGPSRTRTWSQRIKNPLLYRLS